MRIRTGIYGGSFNPIHTGHLTLGRLLCEQGLVDELWFLVSPLNPFKQATNDLLDDQVRLHLVQLAVKDEPQLQASDFEMHLPRPSYMVYTLEKLREEYQDREFVLVIGADNWLRFDQWYKSEEILKHHPILVYPRPEYEIDPSTLPNGVTLTDTPLIDISSTQIRNSIAQGKFDGHSLPPQVWKEIKRQGYYK